MLIHVNPVFFPFIKISRRASNLQTVVASNPPGHAIEEFEMTPDARVQYGKKHHTGGGVTSLDSFVLRVFTALGVKSQRGLHQIIHVTR